MHQRLFEIVYYLTQHSHATAGDLAERFQVSRRTIYRDLDALSQAGIPVYAEKGKGGGIRLLPGFVLDKSLLTKPEQQHLLSSFQGLAALGIPDAQSLADKLSALFGREENWLEVDFAPWGGGEESRAVFQLLRQAILDRKLVQFEYVGAQGAADTRLVEPSKLFFRGQGWYLQGFCRLRQDYRFFKLTRLTRLQMLDEGFERKPPPPIQLPPLLPSTPYLLSFSREMGFRVRDEFFGEQIETLPDGSFLVHCLFPDGDWILGYLLSFGPGLRVLSPPETARQLAELGEKICQNYSFPTTPVE